MALVLMALISCCTAADVQPSVAPAFPAIPRAYTATVSANFGLLNYTLAYTEAWSDTKQSTNHDREVAQRLADFLPVVPRVCSRDAVSDPSAPRLRTQGRFDSANSIEILTFNASQTVATSLQFALGSTGAAACTASQVPAGMARQLLGPSKHFFEDITRDPSTLTYVGRSDFHLSRYLVCDQWNGSFNFSNDGVMQRVISFSYFAAAPEITGAEWVPVRIDVSGRTINTTDGTSVADLAVVFDWIDFTLQIPDPALFVPPTGCAAPLAPPQPDLPLRYFNFFETLPSDMLPPAPLPAADATMPAVPLNFLMTMEAKIDPVVAESPDEVGGSAAPLVFSYQWALNATAGSSRLDYEVLTEETNKPGLQPGAIVGSGQFVRIDQIIPTAVGGRTVYEYRNDNKSVCTANPLTMSNPSPLESRRAGSLSNLFSNRSEDAAFRAGKFVARETLRGVQVDHWVVPNLHKFNGDALYLFDSHVYFFVPGWRFPGRTLSPNQGLPMRVINKGMWMNNTYTNNTEYEDIYDFFLILPEMATAEVFSPQRFGCPPPSNYSPPFPAITDTTSYHMRISAAMLNRGYTLAYEESFDAARRLLRTDGRSGYYSVGEQATEILDFGAQTSTVYSPVSGLCYKSPIVASPMSGPSSSFITRFSNLLNAADYVGRAADADSRYVLTDRWQTVSTLETGNNTGVGSGRRSIESFVTTWMMTVAAPGIPAVPLRVRVSGSNFQRDVVTGDPDLTTARVFSHVYDFIRWETGTPAPETFTIPAAILPGCQTVTRQPHTFEAQFRPQPSAATIVPPVKTPPFPQAPSLGASFSAVVEAKILRPGSSVPTVYSVSWKLDRSRIPVRERITVLGNTPDTTTTQVMLYDSFPNSGRIWTLKADGSCAMAPMSESYTNGALSGGAYLWSAFSGALLDAMVFDPEVAAAAAATPAIPAPAGFSFAYEPRRDLAMEADRGLRCDVYTGARVAASSPSTSSTFVNYTSRFFTAGEGWVYMGSNITHRPVRVIVQGNQAFSNDGFPATASDPASQSSRPFTAIVDLFHYNQQAQLDSSFDVVSQCSNYAALMGIPPSPVPTPVVYTGDNNVGGAVVGLIICIVILLGLAWMGFKRSQERVVSTASGVKARPKGSNVRAPKKKQPAQQTEGGE